LKQVNLKLHKNQAIILNRDIIYIEPEEDVEFIITNELKPSDELYYSLQVGEPKKIDSLIG